jgi:tRNA threonylcarbamoyladenosine biosynthesis protein TsaE
MLYIPVQNLKVIDPAAREFLARMGDSRIIAISGEMGAGKTTFIQSVCKAMGVSQTVNSPTFSLINEYFTEDGESIYHFDFYRIEKPEELLDIGYEDYMYSGSVCFIEWPEKAWDLIPADALHAKIVVMEDGSRRIQMGVT